MYNTKSFLFTDGVRTQRVSGSTYYQALDRAVNEYGLDRKTIKRLISRTAVRK